MQDNNQEYKDRQIRLVKWFKEHPKAWQDVKAELDIMKSNVLGKLIKRKSFSRDHDSGYYSAIDEVINLKDYYKNMVIEDKE